MMEFVNGKDYPIYDMENNKCLKSPTRSITGIFFTRWKLLDVCTRNRLQVIIMIPTALSFCSARQSMAKKPSPHHASGAFDLEQNFELPHGNAQNLETN